MTLTDNPNDPRLAEAQKNETGQHAMYLVLSEEERRKGFVRPLYRSYRHVGCRPRWPLRDLTDEEKARYEQYGYVKYEEYPPDDLPLAGRFWTEEMLNSGCGTVTTMGLELCETYARNPKFYGATFCCGCNRHFPVEEFVWVDEDGADTQLRVGS